MTDDNNIIDLKARVPSHLARVDEDTTWETVCENAIKPAFELMSQNMMAKGRANRIQKVATDSYYTRPFMLLSWHGEKALEGIQLALHFTYGGRGLVGFDLSALRYEDDTKLQTSYLQRKFNVGEGGETMTSIFHIASLGLGYATALEEFPVDPRWRVVKLPQDQMC